MGGARERLGIWRPARAAAIGAASGGSSSAKAAKASSGPGESSGALFIDFFCQILAKSSQNFASNIAFFSVFQNLQDFPKFCKKIRKIRRNFANSLEVSKSFLQIMHNFAKFYETL